MAYVEKSWEIERMFYDEVRDKKRTGRGTFHNITKRGGKGVKSVKSALDVLKANDKAAYKKYIEGGEIIMSNMYTDLDQCPTLEEFKKKEHAVAQTIIKTMRASHTIKDISKHFNISGYGLYKMFDEFGIDYVKRGPRKDKEVAARDKAKAAKAIKDPLKADKISQEEFRKLVKEAKEQQQLQQQQVIIPVDEVAADPIPVVKLDPVADEDNFQIKFNKPEVNGQEIQDRLLSYVSILETDTKYSIKLIIKEL